MYACPCKINFCGHSNNGNMPKMVGLISLFFECLRKDIFHALLCWFQSVLHVYKKHVHMYKIVHLQTFLGYNQCPCAQGRRECLTASSQAIGQRPAPSLQLSSVFQATQSSLSSPLPENKITNLPVFWQPVIPGLFITNALYGHDKGFHAARMTMAWAGSVVGETLHFCLSAHQVSIKSIRYGLQEALLLSRFSHVRLCATP